jgi:hypothetical protein
VNATLGLDQARPLPAEALARRQAAGVDTSALNGIDVRIADPGGLTRGKAAGPTLRQDDEAAWGWFLAPTRRDDRVFTPPGNQGEQHHLDLLTVLAHEVGHLPGEDHEADGLMAQTPTPATRTDPSWDPNPVDVAALDQAFAPGKTSLAFRSQRDRSWPGSVP